MSATHGNASPRSKEQGQCPMHSNSVLDRLMKKVEKRQDGCWIWNGAKTGNTERAYGVISIKSVRVAPMLVHRVVYESRFGPVPDGLDVCHSCDNRLCVNPDHLWTGTRKQNMQDCASKGRHWSQTGKYSPPKGSSHPMARINEDDVVEIRKLHSSGKSMAEIGRAFGVTKTSVWQIIRMKNWTHA
jgi:hypothetical protein